MDINLNDFKITDYFQRGTVVKTQTQNSIECITNVVFDTYSNRNEIGIIFDDRYNNSVILVGDSIKLNYPFGKTQYFMETTVTSIRIEAVKIMTLKIKSIVQIPNLRKLERYSVNYGAHIWSVDDAEKKFVAVFNISLSGVAFVSKQTYFIGDNVKILILISENKFEINGEIIWGNQTEKGFEYGVKFIKTDKIKNELEEMINDLKRREEQLSKIIGFNLYQHR